jgi:hypothetical protein
VRIGQLTLFVFTHIFSNDCLIYICVQNRDWQTGKNRIKRKREKSIDDEQLNRLSMIIALDDMNWIWLFFLFHIYIYIYVLIVKEKIMKIRASCYFLCKYVCMNTTPSDWTSIRNVIYEGLVFVKGNLMH